MFGSCSTKSRKNQGFAARAKVKRDLRLSRQLTCGADHHA
jgi:hypothetical protein